MYQEISSNKRNSVILMMIFIAIIIGLGWVLEKAFGDGSYAIVYIAVIFSIFSVVISYFKGDKIALAATGAKAIKKEDNRYLYNMVENLCIATGSPLPKIYIIEDAAINAFATGRKPELSSIAVTQGAIEKLENEELEGVLAHELSHIKNYDIRFMMLVAVMVGAVVMMSDFFIRSRLWGGRDRKNNAGGIILIVGIVLAILSPLIAELIKLAISRRREYLADASGALITRYPEGLANALEKIARDNQPMQKASKATAHLFLASPFRGAKKLSKLFATHPPIEERVKKMRGMGR